MIAILRRFAWAGACLLGWSQVHASCVIGVPHPTIHVGSASDPKCNYTSIQAAINSVSTSATCPPNIVIANKPDNAAWNEALTITDRSLALIGNADTCTVNIGGAVPDAPSATTATAPQAIISGVGLNAPVITISGNSNVTVQSLEITGGNIGQDAEGGGIFYNGNGSLTLNATTVDNNQAGYGAGIDVTPTGSATLTLQANTLIISNTAGHSGGGIRIEGQTRMYMLGDGSTVSFNTAQFDYGGGIEILGPARADIGSDGSFGVGAVSNNSAPYGGGIAVIAKPNNTATARLFTTSTTRPVQVSANLGSVEGGAFYLLPDGTNDGSEGKLCLFNFLVTGNQSPDGAAIYGDDAGADVSIGSSLFFNPGGDCGPESPASLGAVACAAGTACNEISDNAAMDGSDQPTSGSIVSMPYYYSFSVNRFAMHDNEAAQLVWATSQFSAGNLSTCLISGNHTTHELLHVGNFIEGPGTIGNCTIASNAIDNGYVIYAAGDFTLKDSIIDQPGVATLDYINGGLCVNDPSCINVNDVLSDSVVTLPYGPDIQSGDPLFVDAAHGDFHLQAYLQNGSATVSEAIDFAPAIGGTDLDGRPCDQDVPMAVDAFGIRDLGAYEMQPIKDRVFADGFGDRVSLVY